MQRLVGLYLTDGWQPDVILLCCAEVARQGRRTIAAVARELIRWREAGVETGEDAERYLRRCKQREQWCAEAAEQFGHCRGRPDPLGAQRHRPLARGLGHWPRDDRRSAAARGQQDHHPLCGRHPARLARPGHHHRGRPPAGRGSFPAATSLATQRPAPQQPAAASAQQPLSSRDWMAMFDEEG